MLETLVVLLAATAIAVPVSRRLGFGSILGYLVAGVAIGPAGLRLVADVEQIARVSELGVVMLLFLIGLELQPHRLWILRKAVFGLGLGQMVPTAVLLGLIAHAAGLAWPGAAVLGAGLALSSTAIVLPMLAERDLLPSTAGRDAFAVLLFQDIAFVPLVALTPLLAAGHVPDAVPWPEVARGIGVVAAILLGGWLVVPRLFRAVGGAKTHEVFTATALLVVVGAAALAHWGGLSASLGAFAAGVLLSDTEWRHEIKADIEPFQGLLLGFFFISVGMSADLGLALDRPALVAGGVAALVATKIAVAFVLGLWKRGSVQSASRFGFSLAQGSEFAFVLFGVAAAHGALARGEAELATLVVAASMVAAPIVFSASERLLIPRLGPHRPEPAFDAIDGAGAPVIICGFGRMGQIVGRVLHMRGIAFTALDKDPTQIAVVRRFGGKVYYGDPERADVLRAAGAETAQVLVVAADDPDSALAVVDAARREFPHLAVLARARNRRHAHLLMDRGVGLIVRETFHSSLKLSALVMERLGITAEEAAQTIRIFAEHDERNLVASQAIHHDEARMIQSAREAAEELAALLEADRQREDAPASVEAKT